jgi:hypothetical protein
MRRAARFALLPIVLGSLVAAPAAAAEPLELAGLYALSGVNPDGTEYRGLVHIEKQRDSFLVSWIFPRGGSLPNEPTSVGVGIQSGATFAVSYYSASMAGLVVYRIEEDGQRLDGEWTSVDEDGVVHAETLTRLPDAEPAPEPDAAADEPAASEPFETPTKPTIPPGTVAL